ncbi:MAG: hypothetical protein GXP54_08960 [Deltaproteobacteria bacterium]|nr:hypothetical protein [Deltaproteobacteria bacterium]
MKLAVVGGVHASGKTSLILHVARHAARQGLTTGVYKIDAMEAGDDQAYGRHDIPAVVHAAPDICPDHEAMGVLDDAYSWGLAKGLDLLVIETAGLCHRCSPFLGRFLSICAVSGLAGILAPAKMRPLVEGADIVVLTRSEMISQAERQVFLDRLRELNPSALVMHVDGLTGEGTLPVARAMIGRPDSVLLPLEPLRARLPMGYCHFCQGPGAGRELGL